MKPSIYYETFGHFGGLFWKIQFRQNNAFYFEENIIQFLSLKLRRKRGADCYLGDEVCLVLVRLSEHDYRSLRELYVLTLRALRDVICLINAI